jgi:hypothetical protein
MFTMDLSPRGNNDVDAYVRSFEPNQVQLVVPHRVMAFTLKGRKLIIRRWPAAGTMRVGSIQWRFWTDNCFKDVGLPVAPL